MLARTQKTVWLIDWKHPEKNHFAIAEEVTISGSDDAAHTKRPDIVLYVNGIALGVLELKRSIVSVAEGIRQNLDNQKKIFIEHFFSTQQLVMAGNDTEGLRYATIQTPEKYYLTWKEPGEEENLLDRSCCNCARRSDFLKSSTTSSPSIPERRSSAATTSISGRRLRKIMFVDGKAASFGIRKVPARV